MVKDSFNIHTSFYKALNLFLCIYYIYSMPVGIQNKTGYK